jgi:hypothetical protein
MSDLEWHENKLRRRMEVAAPEMLAALKLVRSSAEQGFIFLDGNTAWKIDEAILAATGEP